MAINETFKVDLIATQIGQQNVNTFWYNQGSVNGNAADLAAAFLDVVFDVLKLIQSSTVLYQTLKVYSHSDPLNFTEIDLTPQVGGAAANSLPTYVAVGFYQPRKRTDMRQGAKRFSGCPDANDTVGTITNAGYLTALGNLADAMSQTISAPTPVGSYSPVIVRRVKVTENGKTYYKVPDIITVNDYYLADSWAYRTETTSQNSRKKGKGV